MEKSLGNSNRMKILCKLCLVEERNIDCSLCSKCLKKEEHRVKEQNKRAHKKKIKERLSIKDWIISLERHNFSCAACKGNRNKLTLDHIISMSVGGKNCGDSNIQPLCSPCHELKSTIETKLKGNKKKRLEAKELSCDQPT